MKVDFYSTELSPPCRAVWMALETLGVDYEWKEISTLKGETRTPEFLKLNPLHTVPTIVDDDFAIPESRAILLHLARKYGKANSTLYPTNLRLRSQIEQRLFFDLGHVWAAASKIIGTVFRTNTMYDEAALDALKEALGHCEKFVQPTGFIAATTDISVADISILANYTSLRACGLFNVESYPGLEAWADRCEKLIKNYEKCNGAGAEKIGAFFKGKVEALRSEAEAVKAVEEAVETTKIEEPKEEAAAPKADAAEEATKVEVHFSDEADDADKM